MGRDHKPRIHWIQPGKEGVACGAAFKYFVIGKSATIDHTLATCQTCKTIAFRAFESMGGTLPQMRRDDDPSHEGAPA